jgi:hypothetical protein
MAEQHEIEYLLTVNADLSFGTMRKLESVIVRNLAYVQRLFGNEDLNKAIDTVQRAIMTLRIMQSALHAFEIASGPLGWAYAITAGVGAAFATSDFMMSLGE